MAKSIFNDPVKLLRALDAVDTGAENERLEELRRHARRKGRLSDLERVERDTARVFLKSYDNLTRLRKRTLASADSVDAFVAMYTLRPEILAEERDRVALNEVFHRLLDEQTEAFVEHAQAQSAHMKLVNRQNKALGAAKARQKKTQKTAARKARR